MEKKKLLFVGIKFDKLIIVYDPFPRYLIHKQLVIDNAKREYIGVCCIGLPPEYFGRTVEWGPDTCFQNIILEVALAVERFRSAEVGQL